LTPPGRRQLVLLKTSGQRPASAIPADEAVRRRRVSAAGSRPSRKPVRGVLDCRSSIRMRKRRPPSRLLRAVLARRPQTQL